MTWTTVCSTADVAEDGDSFRVDSTPRITVFNSGGELFATADTCSHAAFSLADGYVEAATVECPVHLATFCLRTGAALKMPAKDPIATYPVKADGDAVVVDLPE